MSIIFHVGLPKSASTYLQRKVFPLIDNTDFSSTEDKICNLYEWVYDSNSPLTPLHAKRSIKRKKLEQLNSRIENNLSISDDVQYQHHRNKLVSSEGFVGLSWDPLLNSDLNSKLIKIQHPSAKIFLVLRRQADWISSLYRQLIYVEDRFRHYIPFQNFIGIDSPKNIVSILDLRWDLLVEQYYSIFGCENVLVLPYELLKESPSDFINTFFGFFNLKSSQKIDFAAKENVFTNINSEYKSKLSLRPIISSIKRFKYDQTIYELSSLFNNFYNNDPIKDYDLNLSCSNNLNDLQALLNSYNKRLNQLCDFDFSFYNY